MSKDSSNHLKLGIFVASGTLLLIVVLYMIGSKRNVFSATIKISAVFYNVNGLMAGNNVRYAGIDVGTVDKVEIENDTTVHVYMMVEKKVKEHIKKNAIAAIGTDGLMGNKLVSITPVPEPSLPIEEGDVLHSQRGVETEEMVRTLNITNDNVAAITRDLRIFTSKINNDRGIMNIWSDSASAQNIREALAAFREVAENARHVTVGLNDMVNDMKNGKGLVGTLLNDTTSASRLKNTIRNLEHVSDSLNIVTKQLGEFSGSLNNPHGLVHTLTRDSAIAKDMKSTVSNLKVSTELLNEDLKAMQQSFLLKGYFKDKEKAEKKAKSKKK